MDHILVIPLFSRLLHRIINRAAALSFVLYATSHEDIFNGIYGSRVSYFGLSKFLLHSESSSLNFFFLFCLCCLPICIKLALTGDELFRASPPPLDHKSSWAAVTLTDTYRNHRWCDVTVRGWVDLEWYLSDLWQIKWGYLSKSIIMWLWCSWLSWALWCGSMDRLLPFTGWLWWSTTTTTTTGKEGVRTGILYPKLLTWVKAQPRMCVW